MQLRIIRKLAIGIAFAAMSLSMLAASTHSVFAQSKLCRQLEAQLVATSAGGGGSSNFRKYDRAAKKQREQLDIARRNAKQQGCVTGGFSLFSRALNTPECRSLVTTINRMEQNLDTLERRREQYDRRSSVAERARLLAALGANGCRGAEREAMTSDGVIDRRRRVNILEQIFNESRRRAPLEEHDGSRIRTTLNGADGHGLGSMVGSYRTLCVRTCDGYYFPVSTSVSEFEFDRDLKACQAMCPGTEVELYVHKFPGEESEDMVSLAGAPYTELPAAFLYRQPGYEREKSCGCSPVKNFQIVAGEPKIAEETADTEVNVPFPTERPDPAADPETLDNRDGGLTLATIARILMPNPVADKTETIGGRKVRVVGPVFLPDPEGAIDLRARDRNSVQ